MRGRHSAGAAGGLWNRAGALPVPAMAYLSITLLGRGTVPEFSVGHSAAGSRFPGDLFCSAAMAAAASAAGKAAFADRAVAAALAPVQTHVPVRCRETEQWRPDLAQRHRAGFPFRNPAVADVDWLVRASTASLGASERSLGVVCDRNGNSVPDFFSAPPAPTGLPGLSGAAIVHLAHR